MRLFTRCLGIIGLLSLMALFIYLVSLPYVPRLKTRNPSSTALMERRNQEARAAGRKLRSQWTWRPLSQVSPNLIHAVLLSEDDRFYQHSGFDFEQIREALRRDWAKHRYAYGGSTITQQLARTLYLSPRKSLLRKSKEALITVWLEHSLSKRRILELYLNVVEWGPGIYGADAAAQHYFHKTSLELTPDEAVALTSILPSPRRWSPTSEKGFMARRRTRLLERMETAGYLPVVLSTSTVGGDPYSTVLRNTSSIVVTP